MRDTIAEKYYSRETKFVCEIGSVKKPRDLEIGFYHILVDILVYLVFIPTAYYTSNKYFRGLNYSQFDLVWT